MKSVVLIGDSLRLHYQPLVQAALAGEAEVWGPPENCGSSRHVRERLGDWLVGRQPDLVHINCGLHDLRYDPGSDVPLVSPAEYADNLDHIFTVLKAMPASRLLWATSTPIDERRHNASRASRRFASDVALYNGIAREIARRHGIEVHDLDVALVVAGPDTLLKDDGVHFTAMGYQFLAERVVAVIRSTLGLGGKTVHFPGT